MSEPTLWVQDFGLTERRSIRTHRPATDDDLGAAGLFRAEREVWWCGTHKATAPVAVADWPHCYEWWMREVAGDGVPQLEEPCRLTRRPLGPPLDQPAVTIRPVKEMRVELEDDDE